MDDLRAHGVLDTEAEADFDALTRMAAACGTPIARVGFAALAAFVRRAWWPLAAVHLAGAAASLAFFPPAVDAAVIPVAAVLFARLWRCDLKDRPERT